MGYKETVMSAKQVAITKYPILKSARGVIWEEYYKEPDKSMLEAQAEITWEARDDEVKLLHSLLASKHVAITDLKSLLEMAQNLLKTEREARDKEVDDAEKAGIKKVVDLLNRHQMRAELNHHRFDFSEGEWQTFLEEVGLLPSETKE